MKKPCHGSALVRRILELLELGPRPANWCRFMATGQKEYERAIGYLALRGLILFKGKTSGRVIALNGRRKAA